MVNYNADVDPYTQLDRYRGYNGGETTDVGIFPPNGFGLYDMHGNVLEWCQDVWHENYNGAPTDGSAWETGGNAYRSPLRGGCWLYHGYNCRSAYRDFNSRRGGNAYTYGFRIVWSGGRTELS